jgi:hypothetical protein
LCSYFSSTKDGLSKEVTDAYRLCRSDSRLGSESGTDQEQNKQLLALVVSVSKTADAERCERVEKGFDESVCPRLIRY